MTQLHIINLLYVRQASKKIRLACKERNHPMYYGTFCNTPIGRLAIICTETALHAIDCLDDLPCQNEKIPIVAEVERQLNEYFSGVRRKLDVPIDETLGTTFQRKVWQAVMNIPYGQTRSYGEVASMIGKPKAARAVGSAMACTPIPIAVPCHRVVSSKGISGYGGNLQAKEYMIAMEKNYCRQEEGKVYVLFDLDGTLTDPKEGITKCVQYALADFGIIEPDLDALTCFIGPPLLQSFREYYGFDEEEAKRAVAKYRERFSTVGLFENSVFEGVHEMLNKLREKGKVICLATSKPEVYAKKIIEKYGINKYFDIVVGSELDGRRTNKAEVIEEVLHQLAVKAEYDAATVYAKPTADIREKAIMVGDRHHDIDGAKTCRMESIGVRFGYAEPGELEEAGATYIADTVEDLTKLLLQI